MLLKKSLLRVVATNSVFLMLMSCSSGGMKEQADKFADWSSEKAEEAGDWTVQKAKEGVNVLKQEQLILKIEQASDARCMCERFDTLSFSGVILDADWRLRTQETAITIKVDSADVHKLPKDNCTGKRNQNVRVKGDTLILVKKSRDRNLQEIDIGKRVKKYSGSMRVKFPHRKERIKGKRRPSSRAKRTRTVFQHYSLLQSYGWSFSDCKQVNEFDYAKSYAEFEKLNASFEEKRKLSPQARAILKEKGVL